MTDELRIFDDASAVLSRFRDALERRAPGMFTACHVIGSIALGDARPGKSDIDLVLIRDTTVSNARTVDILEAVLAEVRQTRPKPFIDGLVLSTGDLEAGPDRIDGDRPIIFDSRVRPGGDGSARNPVTWQTLRQCGIAVWGEPIDMARLWHDPARLDRWTRENLESYWLQWLAKSDRLLSRFGWVSLGEWATEWGVLGVTRLHYTLATGEVASKHGAGVYAREAFDPRWHRIIDEALRIRAGCGGRGRYRNPLARRQEMRAFVAMVIDDALDLPERHHTGP